MPGSEGQVNKMVSTPINIKRLRIALDKHPDRCFATYLLDGLTHGFCAGLSELPTVKYECNNLQSALREPGVVDTLLQKETTKGFMIGPIDESPFSSFRVSPIGVATGKYSGKKRLIVDLSAPHGCAVASINSLLPRGPFSLYYASVDNAIHMIKIAGAGAWLGKADVTDAFKVMPLHPSQWYLFVVRWCRKLYFSVWLTFGCRSSPRVFHTVGSAVLDPVKCA